MGLYLNPGGEKFRTSIRSEIYVDKSELIAFTNKRIRTEQKYLCVSRPRRFGKSMALGMLAAYYGCEETTDDLFSGLKICQDPSYTLHLNQYDTITVNMQTFLSRSEDMDSMLALLETRLIKELRMKYPLADADAQHLDWAMGEIFAKTKKPFIILIDEWDCVFREYTHDTRSQKKYLDFLRLWLKDQDYVGLAYMTGILPVKKYGSHSALNMFTEYSMVNPKQLAPYFGFTEDEVQLLCAKYHMDFEGVKAWYDGYHFQLPNDFENGHPHPEVLSVYSPKSVVEAMLCRKYDSYWNQTETYEALKIYIQMNYDGLKDSVIEMLAGGSVKVNVGTFSNDMETFTSQDDILTLLIHLGYATYSESAQTVEIPNKEVSGEYVNAIKVIGWKGISTTMRMRSVIR